VKFEQLLLFVTILSLSSNLFLKIGLETAYVRGLLLDYLIPKIYLFDCLLLSSVAIFFLKEKNRKIFKKNKIKLNKIDVSILITSSLVLFNQFLNPSLSSLIFHLRLVLLGLFVLSIYLDKLRLRTFYQALLASVVWQSFLAYYQFFNQQSFAPYHFFGESNLQQFANISRGQFLKAEKILPYGSTAHPNILAGLVVIFNIILFKNIQLKKSIKSLLLFNSLVIIILSQSLAALLSFLIFLIYLFFEILKMKNKELKKPILSWQKFLNFLLVLFFLFSPFIIQLLDNNLEKNHLSISRRAMLNKAAWQMFIDQPVFGIGLNNFVRELESYSQNREVVRFVQPVHHLGLLILSEGGIITSGLLLLIIWKLRTKLSWSKILLLIPIASLDHYLITQVAGLTSLILIIFFSSRNRRRT
jgi:putative inorganic carbon (hco3(-)) transporter